MSPERVISYDGDAEPYVIFEKFIRAHSPLSEDAIDAYLNEARKLLEAGSTFFCRRNFFLQMAMYLTCIVRQADRIYRR